MEQDHLPCSCDQEVFERVWRRVMPEDRPDCPFTLGEDAAAPPAVQPPAAALPAVVHTAPAGEQAPSRPVVGEEHDVPCLGASSAVYGAQLQRLIDRELADWRAYQALSRRAQGNSGRVLATIAAAALSEIFARLYKTPATVFLIIGIIPLVPGGGIYYAMSYCLAGDTGQFLNALLDTLGMAAALAVGVILASSLFRAVFPRLVRPTRSPSSGGPKP